jgi:hypothetical protein
MIHHAFKHAAKRVAKYYGANPHKAVSHGSNAVQIGSMAWTHGHKVATHSAKFLAKAASKGFSLFNS